MTASPTSGPQLGGDANAAVELSVTGMHCGSCSALIEEVLLESPAVVHATVDLDRAVALIDYRPGEVSVDDLCALIAEAGYEARPAESTGAVS